MKNRIAGSPRWGAGVRSLFRLSDWGMRQPWRVEEPVPVFARSRGTRVGKPGRQRRNEERRAA
jgi:hypothetical protein